MSRAALPRHLAQDRAGRGARAPGAAEREAPRRCAASSSRTTDVREAVAISTCNRTEVYVVVGDPVAAETEAAGPLAQRAGIRPTELAEAIYSPRNCDAARQLFRVVSGLESMIVGEAEIQGQVKRAYEARAGGRHDRAADQPPVHRRAATGKRVRSETAIGEGRVSVSSVAVDAGPRGRRRPRRAPRRGHRRGRDQRADRAGAGRAGRAHDLRGQPPRRPRALDRRALRRHRRRRWTSCPSA